MTAYLVISLPKLPHAHRIYIYDPGQPYSLAFGKGARLATLVWFQASSKPYLGLNLLPYLGLLCLLVKEFYGTRYQSDFLFLNQCGEWLSLPA